MASRQQLRDIQPARPDPPLAIRLFGFGIDRHGIFVSVPSRSMSVLSGSRRESNDMTVVWIAVWLYVASFFIPLGFISFAWALDSLMRCVGYPRDHSVGEWLLGLAWLANPAAWIGLVFLFKRSYNRAALAGELAVVLAVLGVGSAGAIPSYFTWLASLMLIVYAALRLPRPAPETTASPGTAPATLLSAKPRLVFYPAVGLPLVLGIALVSLADWRVYRPVPDLPEFDPNENVTHGEDARAKILKLAGGGLVSAKRGSVLPSSADDFWIYDGGWLSKSNFYCTFRCSHRADCLKAVEYLGGRRANELKPWKPSMYAVVMEGPDFYSRTLAPRDKLRYSPWNVRAIKNGLVYEHVQGDNSSMVYCAIDLDRNRVYYIDESGGFRGDEYRPAGDRDRTRPDKEEP
jgi:hypothetical protein